MVKFISYDGKYPNLCRGALTLDIDGRIYIFDHALSSGGTCSFDADWCPEVTQGAWLVNLPIWAERYRDEIEYLVEINIPHGCCGGCL